MEQTKKNCFEEWIAYFHSNRGHMTAIQFEGYATLSPAEKRIIYGSISRLQSGESSSGKKFIKKSTQMDNPGYTQAVRYFVKEEQDHAFILGKFMTQEKISFRKNDLVDTLFRAARNFDNLFQTVHVLLTAEILGMNYYASLKRTTHSKSLQAICGRILRDEVKHIQFQALALRELYKKQSLFQQKVSLYYRRISFYMAAVIFYLLFFKVMETSGLTFVTYLKKVRRNFMLTEKIMKGIIEPKVKINASFSI